MKIGIARTFVDGGAAFTNPLAGYNETALM